MRICYLVEHTIEGWWPVLEHYGVSFRGPETAAPGLSSNGLDVLWGTRRSQPYILLVHISFVGGINRSSELRLMFCK